MIRAIYENGVFRPLDTPNLPDQQQVRLTIESFASDTEGSRLIRLPVSARPRESLTLPSTLTITVLEDGVRERRISRHLGTYCSRQYRRSLASEG
jgi:predicted DNA-binding antitoxin AbrB/MazE fold protein